MDPVSQIFAQSGAGGASGQGFGQFFAEGVQSGQRQQQLNLATRRQQFEEQQSSMLMPLQMEATRLQNEQTGIQVQMLFKQQQQQNAALAKLPELIDIQRRFSLSPQGYADSELLDAAQTIFRQAPTLTEHSVGKEILGSAAAAPKLDTAFSAIIQANKRLQGTGLYVQRLDERGRPVLGETNRAAVPDKLEIADEMSRLQSLIANPNTPPTVKQQAENQLANIQAQMGASSMEVLDPQTGNIIMRQTTGRQPAAATGGPTPANLTEINKQLMSSDTALHELDRAEQAIRTQPSAFGVRGVANELLEVGRGVIDPNTPAPVTDARNEAGIMFTKIAESLRVDSGNMSLYERRQLEKVGDITSWRDNPRAALDKVTNVRNAIVGKELRLLQEKGAKPKDALLRRIPASEVPALVDSGLIDQETLLRWREVTIANAKPKQ